MAIRRTTWTVTTNNGGSGASSGSGGSSDIVSGLVLAVYLAYGGSPPATTDVTIAERTNSPALPVLTKSNYNTDGWLYPRIPVHGVSDGAAISGPVDYQSVNDYLLMSVAQADSVDTVTATVIWDDLRG